MHHSGYSITWNWFTILDPDGSFLFKQIGHRGFPSTTTSATISHASIVWWVCSSKDTDMTKKYTPKNGKSPFKLHSTIWKKSARWRDHMLVRWLWNGMCAVFQANKYECPLRGLSWWTCTVRRQSSRTPWNTLNIFLCTVYKSSPPLSCREKKRTV